MLIAFNKPYGVLCQFRSNDERPTLANYIKLPGVYAAGRLDRDSEGLLLLTDDGVLQQQISAPGSDSKWPKSYLVQVEGRPTLRALQQLERGVKLNDGLTKPAQIELLAKMPQWIWQRQPPIRARKNIPTVWLRIVLREGKNRQVRRMTAAVGFPTLRLIRESIGNVKVSTIPLGSYRVVR